MAKEGKIPINAFDVRQGKDNRGGEFMDEQPNMSGQVYGGFNTIVRILVLALVVVGILLLLRIIFLFFGTLKTVPGYDFVISTTEYMVAPLNNIESVNTPYEGIFDIAATGILLITLLVEFIFSGIQGWLSRQQIKHKALVPRPVERTPESQLIKEEDELIQK